MIRSSQSCPITHPIRQETRPPVFYGSAFFPTMKAFNYPILKLTIFLAIGILVSDNVFISVWTILGGIGFLTFILIRSHFYCKKNKKTLYWPSLLVLLIMMLIGVFISKTNAPSFSKSHYSHFKTSADKQLHQLEFVVKTYFLSEILPFKA